MQAMRCRLQARPVQARPGAFILIVTFPLTYLRESARGGVRLAPDRGVGGWGVRGHWRDRGVGGDQQPVAKRETWRAIAVPSVRSASFIS